MKRITPDRISSLKPNEVFVFGTDLQGKHLSHAARFAYENLGAKIGVGLGLQGQTYAIPIKNGDMPSLGAYIKTFILFAKNNQRTLFYVTPIGCDIGGYTPEQIAPFFTEAVDCTNIFLPNNFWRVIDKKKRFEKYRENIQETNYAIQVSCNSTGCRTSNYPYFCIDVQVQGANLIVSSGISNKHVSLCTILKRNDIEIEKDYIDGSLQFIKKLPVFNKQPNTLDLYFQKDPQGYYYRQLSIPVEIVCGTIKLGNTPFSAHNISFFNNIPTDAPFLKSVTTLTAIVPGALTEFKELVNKITKYDNSVYNKLLSIHDWVAKNIYYDYDSINDGSYKNTSLEKTAIVALRSKRCVCQGYTDLSVALLRSIGIPAMGIRCWAVGEGDDEDALRNNRSNHIFTAAYIDQRWILCDITWDSKNRYEKESFDEDKKLSHTYFDATVQFLSYTHKFIGY